MENRNEKGKQLGIDPDSVEAWRVNRDTDPNRCKVLMELQPNDAFAPLCDSQISHRLVTKSAVKDENGKVIQKGEALEVFWHHGRQVVVMGASRLGRYY